MDSLRSALECSEVIEGLWQGSKSAVDLEVAPLAALTANFDVAIFCADAFQPDPGIYGPVRCVLAPFEDHELLTAPEWEQVERAARVVIDAHRAGASVLVTCHAGLNRSGLVVGLAMLELVGWSPEKVIAWIQHRRRGALGNGAFRRIIRERWITLQGW